MVLRLQKFKYDLQWYYFAKSINMSKTIQKIDLNNMKLFVSVVQAGSLTRASELLCLPKSYLSRHLTELEESLGTVLMDRGRKGIILNEAGKRFYTNCQEMLAAAQFAIDDIQESLEQPQGLLRLSVSTEVGQSFLMYHLAEYLQKYPDVQLEIQIDNRKINLIQDGVDIAFRVGSIDNDNVVARKLLDIEFGLFADQSYLTKKGVPKTPRALYEHELIYKYDGPTWQFRCKQQSIEIDRHYKIRCNDFYLAGQMVTDGIGIALLPLFANLIQPNWVRLLPQWQIQSVPLYLVYYKNRGSAATVRSMVEFLLAKFS